MIADYRPTPRQLRTAIDLIAGAMVVSVAFALAGLTWRLAGHAGTGAITVPSAGKPVRVGTGTDSALALSPFGKATITDASVPTSIGAELKGVVFAVPTSLSTAFIKVGNDDPKTFAVGDQVAGATIAAIRRDRVILNHGGRMEYLAFPDPFRAPGDETARPGGNSAGASAVTAAPIAQPVPAPSPAADPGALLSRFDARPTPQGYAIGTDAPPGLNAGDVITSVNGQSVSDPASAQSALAAAAASGSAQVQILRNGKTVTVTVPIR
ncbi:PDZ domain-containing protein [Stakelama sp. CBK3Z-3]|uniref:PDZ domain-containing protein n=1 Tax=Stakelama flava TaxID=2860338 RepID=A0ABS6XJC0_9SPHN|nr:type II secretion system protein N [Stakelama flava]MBW4330309.1 PDZ domain-containing protein [Stakelama flava]